MTNKQLESLPQDEQKRIRQAFKMGIRACVFMAREIESLFSNLSVMESCGPEHLVPILEHSIDQTMQSLGDLMNGMDAVDDESEQATDGAFREVAEVLRLYGHKAKR
jgi:hypothetical protein